MEEIGWSRNSVELRPAGPGGAIRRVRARHVVGTDGARSQVREAIGARLEGSTYGQRRLIVDLVGTRDRRRPVVGISDGRRGPVSLPGPGGRHRSAPPSAAAQSTGLA